MLRSLLSAGCLGLMGFVQAQELPGVIPIPTTGPGEVKPATTGSTPTPDKMVVEVQFTQSTSKGLDFLVSTLADSKKTLARHRDYVAHMIRQERVGGTLLAEQTCELRYRNDPMSVSVKVVEPKAQRGAEMIYVHGSKDNFVRVRAAGISSPWLRLAMNDPKLLTGTRHTLENTGLMSVLNRVDKILTTENKARNPVQVTSAEYKFADRDCWRFEIVCDRPHQLRYAHRTVLFVEKESKMPVRWEAYDSPKSGESKGELLECYSFLNVKFNVGLGDSSFEN